MSFFHSLNPQHLAYFLANSGNTIFVECMVLGLKKIGDQLKNFCTARNSPLLPSSTGCFSLKNCKREDPKSGVPGTKSVKYEEKA